MLGFVSLLLALRLLCDLAFALPPTSDVKFEEGTLLSVVPCVQTEAQYLYHGITLGFFLQLSDCVTGF